MAQIQWDPGPAKPLLAAGAVDVWGVDLADPALDVAALGRLLSDGERERAARFLRPGDGERWTAAHGILRALLAAYLDADPRALRFANGPHGKPGLAGREAADLRFNLSHSGDTALIAFACAREVGVDVELPRMSDGAAAIAHRVFDPAEAERIAGLPPEQRGPAFLAAWVRWEAVLKCHGTGIAAANSAPPGLDPWVVELPIDPPAAAALAVAGGPPAVRCWRWPSAEPGPLRTISRP